MTERRLPGRTGLADRLRPRPRDVGQEERWGYAVWSFVAAVISIPEIISGVSDKAPWPTISETVGELEWLWTPTSIVVVGFFVFVLAHAVKNPLREPSQVTARHAHGRTPGGRFTMRPGRASRASRDGNVVAPLLYFPLALLVVIAGSVFTAVFASDRFALGYVLYSLLAIFFLIIPSVLAAWYATDVPFPTLSRTVANLERRFHFAAILVIAGLVIFALHLVFYPWPDIAHVLQRQPP